MKEIRDTANTGLVVTIQILIHNVPKKTLFENFKEKMNEFYQWKMNEKNEWKKFLKKKWINFMIFINKKPLKNHWNNCLKSSFVFYSTAFEGFYSTIFEGFYSTFFEGFYWIGLTSLNIVISLSDFWMENFLFFMVPKPKSRASWRKENFVNST